MVRRGSWCHVTLAGEQRRLKERGIEDQSLSMAGALQESLVLRGTGGNVIDQSWVNPALMADLLLKHTSKGTFLSLQLEICAVTGF